MASVAVTIDGVLWHLADKSGEAVRLEGQGFLSDLVVDGGPIIPPQPPEIPPDIPAPVPPSSVLKEPPAEGGWGLYSDSGSTLYWGFTPSGGTPKHG